MYSMYSTFTKTVCNKNNQHDNNKDVHRTLKQSIVMELKDDDELTVE